MKSFIAFDRNKIYTSLLEEDHNPDDIKLELLIRLTTELGKFGYILDQGALLFLSTYDILQYEKDIIPVLYDIYYHKKYNSNQEQYISLSEWKNRRKQPWIDNFYLNGDFRFITESSRSINRSITYLDRLNDNDLYEIYKSEVISKNNPKDLETIKYLAELFKNSKEIINPGNSISTLILGLYNDSIRPKNWSEYTHIHLGRKERRLILDKLEKLDLDKENRTDLKKLLHQLHPNDFKKLYPKVYKYWTERKTNQENPYIEAEDLLRYDMIEEFKEKFISFLYRLVKESSGLESDLITLLYSEKLQPSDLLQILNKVRKIELGCPRYYGQIIKLEHNKVVSLIPTIKEFIFSSLGCKIGNKSLNGKRVWIDPELKEINFGFYNTLKRDYLGKINLNDNLEISSVVLSSKISDNLTSYLWKGPGKVFKLVPSRVIRKGNISASGYTLDMADIEKKGFKYLVFNNKMLSYLHSNKNQVKISIQSGKDNIIEVYPHTDSRNNFGGLIDLTNGDIITLDFDLNLLPIINGNIHEAIVKYILPELRFSAYDFGHLYITSSGAEPIETEDKCDVKFEYNDYIEKLKQIS